MSAFIKLLLLDIFIIQFITAAVINVYIKTRIPKSIWDFLKLTFLPYVLYYIFTDIKKLR